MAELLGRMILRFCLAGLGVVVLIAFVRVTLPNAAERMRLAARCAGGKGSLALMVPVLFVCGMILFGGGKSEDSTNAPPAMMQRVVSAPHISRWDEATRQLGYVLAETGSVDSTAFSLPETAERVPRWRRGNFSLDFEPVASTVCSNLLLGSNGTLAGTPYGVSHWPVPDTQSLVLAPALGNYGVHAGLGDICRLRNPYGVERFIWSNLAADRDPSRIVSFATEIRPSGDLVFSYGNAVSTNALAVLQNRGVTVDFTTLVAPMTFLRFACVDGLADGVGDSDGDGLSDYDEVMRYRTDPRSADSDSDGLADADELTRGSDPNDPYSIDGTHPDGVASVLGGIDPFAMPSDSTNSWLECAFYAGTTNADSVIRPRATDSTAVLRVVCTGHGRGRLVIGDQVVPLLPRPSRSRLFASAGNEAPGSDPTAVELRVSVPRGGGRRRLVLYDDSPSDAAGIRVGFDSEEFAFGQLPTVSEPLGWIVFPFVRTETPCVHWADAESDTALRLDPGEDSDGLDVTWRLGQEVDPSAVYVDKDGPFAATLHGNLRPSLDNPLRLTYVLSHAKRLFGKSDFEQELRFCPEVGAERPAVPSAMDVPRHCRCREWLIWPDCLEDSGVCPCGVSDCACATSAPPTEVDYASAYSNLLLRPAAEVVKIGRREPEKKVRLQVTPGSVAPCCACPSHQGWKLCPGYVSPLLELVNPDGSPFNGTAEDVTVTVRGVAPSEAVGDAAITVVSTGVVSTVGRYTVLGLGIDERMHQLRKLNALAPNFGLPIVAAASVENGAELRLRTDVRLPAGFVHIGVSGATTAFRVYAQERETLAWRELIGGFKSTYDTTLLRWNRDFAGGSETVIRIVAAGLGEGTLEFGFAAGAGDQAVSDFVSQKLTVVPPPLLPDRNRDGRIDADDAALATAEPFRFWTNADCWRGDDAFDSMYYDIVRGALNRTNGDDGAVNGRNDLVNLLPLALDMRSFREAWGANRVSVMLRAAWRMPECVRRCFVDVPWGDARRTVLDDVAVDDERASWQVSYEPVLKSALMKPIPHAGETMSAAAVARCDGETGVVLVEADAPCENPFEIIVLLDGVEALSYSPPLEFCDVDEMYDWRNIRDAKWSSTPPEAQSVGTSEAWDGTQFVFVHGYNVSATEARSWGRAVFKRLWWAGMRSHFTVVTWEGNDGQIWLPQVGLITPDYQLNVEHAFASAPALTAVVNALPGRRFVMAHSLGNMVVSSAIQDWGLSCEKYFMVNAAVPAEAYDAGAVTAETQACMTPQEWSGYGVGLRAAGWYDRFETNDMRRALTWKGRFSQVTNAVNFYSTEEEVLRCGNGESQWIYSRTYAWYNQERNKGIKPTGMGRNEGGWAFNPVYDREVYEYDPLSGTFEMRTKHLTPTEAEASATDFRETPFFGPFADSSICGAAFRGGALSPQLKAQLLADAIPAESFPAGFAPIPKWGKEGRYANNCDMSHLKVKQSGGDAKGSVEGEWKHSYFIAAPHMRVRRLFEDIVLLMRGGSNEDE